MTDAPSNAADRAANAASDRANGAASGAGGQTDGDRSTIADLRRRALPILACAPHPTPALDFRLLLASALDSTPTAVAALDRRTALPPSARRWLWSVVRKRRRGAPIAYLIGYKEFYGLRFTVNRSVLVPRPESELLVERACRLATERRWRRLHDCGTGCGNIAIAIRHRLPILQVSASDRSAAALKVARQNCRALLGEVTAVAWYHGRLLAPLRPPAAKIDGIVANLPYLRRGQLRERSIRSEPRQALCGGGTQGERLMRALIDRAADMLTDGGALLMECAPDQVASLCAYAARRGLSRITTHTDLSGRERVIVAEK